MGVLPASAMVVVGDISYGFVQSQALLTMSFLCCRWKMLDRDMHISYLTHLIDLSRPVWLVLHTRTTR